MLVNDRLGSVVDAFYIGKSSFRKTVQNVTLAFAFNGIGVPAAVTGFVHPVFAMIAMAASVTAVLLNSFGGRLLPKVKERLAGEERGTVRQVTLKVPSIHCEGCVDSIRETLAGIEGVEGIEAEVEQKTLTITYRDGAELETDLRNQLTKAGHLVD